jgi:hypothetical protein
MIFAYSASQTLFDIFSYRCQNTTLQKHGYKMLSFLLMVRTMVLLQVNVPLGSIMIHMNLLIQRMSQEMSIQR